MALKDCTFFVDVNGKQVEMDYDQFRAYLLDGTNLSALAPTLVTKKGTKVGFERAEAAPARAEASTAKGEAKAQKGEAKAQKGEAAPEKGEAPTRKKEEKAAPEAKELPPNAPRPVTVENLRLTMGLNKSQAEAVMAVYKAMGLSLPKIRLAKGIEGAEGGLEQSAFHATRQPFTPEPGFPFGRFRLDKIGTGLGRQAQGWGIYLAAKRIRASDYLLDLRKTSPDAVLYDLDVPNKLVAQLPDDEKPLSRKLQVAVNRELKAAGIELTVDSAMSLRDIMDKIQQNAAWGSDANAPRLTSELLDRAGIPGLQRFVKDKLALHMYVIWNQAALDRIALLGANGKKLQTLAQNGQTAQGLIRGSIEFLDETDSERLDGALAIIRGFGAANVTTPIHEGAHFYRRFMLNTENGFTAQEIKAAEDWAGARNGNWSVAAEEKWARGFERYLRSGEAPLPSLTKLFEKLAKWFQNIYKTVIGSEIDVEITPEIRRVFDRIFELQTQKAQSTEGVSTLKQEARTGEAEGDIAKPVWRSNIIEALKSWPQSKGTPAQFMAHLKKVKGAEAEAKWTGLSDFLEGKSTVTRADIEEFASRNAFIVGETQLEGDATKYGRSRTRGGTDYREIILTSPQLNFKTAHFRGIQGYLAHMRVATFRDSSGRKVLLVDEVQSDLHQRGRKEGYRSSEETYVLKNLDQILEQAHERVRQLVKDKNQLLYDLYDLIHDPTGVLSSQLINAAFDVEANLPPELVARRYPDLFSSAQSKGLLDNLKEVMLAASRVGLASQERETLIAESQAARKKVPPAPNPDSSEWAIMVFKRAIRLAVEEGADVVAWTPGGTQNARWLGSGKDLRPFYDTILPAALKKFVKPWGGRLGTTELFFKDVTSRQPLTEEEIASWRVVLDRTENKIKLRESAKEQYAADLKRTKEKGLPTLDIERELNTVSSLLATAIADRQSILTLLKQNEGPITAAGTFPAIELTPQMKAEAQKGFTLFQAEGSGGDSTAKARAEAIRQNRERMQARREQAGGDTSKQQKGGGTTQQQKGGSSAPRQGRTRSKPQTLSDMLRIAEEQVQAAAEREPQTDTEKRQAQAQRAVMALLRDYVRLKAQGNLPDSYTKADGTQVNREAELFDALTAMLDSATDPDDDARKATRKALSARFDEILPGRVKSKAGQPKTLQDMLREAERNIRGAAGKKVLSAQEKAQERADQEIKYLIREYAQKMYAGRLTDDLELPDGTTVSREQELLDALDALRDALKIPKEGLRLKARENAMRRVNFALLAPPLETRKQPLNIRNLLTGHAGWGRLTVRSPLSYLNYIGSYERIAGTTGRLVSDTFNEVRTRFARGQYRNFNSALADLRIQLRPLKQQLIDEGYGGLPEVIDAHVQRIEESSRNLGELSVANVKKAWQNGDLNLAANLVSSILKAFVFNAKLRLNPKSIGLNYLQPLFTLYPYFTSEEMVRLYKDSLNPDTRARVRDIAIAESGGRFTLEMQQGQTSRIPNPFTAASEQVRIMGHLAGEMLADRLKLPEGIERDMYIRSWAEKAEFDNSPWNAGPLFTGPIASVVLQFKPYMVKNLERFITDVKKNPVIGERISEKKQRITARQAKVLLVQAGIGGLSSLLTLAPPLRILAGPIMLGLLAKFIGGLADDEEVGERMAEAIYFGVPSAFALDLSSSVGFIEEPFGRSPADKFASALGPAVSMAYQGYTQADDIYELATRPQKVGESEAVKKELGERTWKLGKALTPYTRMVEAGYSLATGTRPEMFLDKETPLTTGETVGRLFGLSPVRQASYYEMKEAPDLAKRIVGMQPDIAGIPRERGETDKTYRVKVQRVTEWRDSYGKQLENHPRFKTLDKATKDKALEIINGNISAEAAKVKPNLSNLRPEYVIRRAKESIRQAPRRARRQMYVPPPED